MDLAHLRAPNLPHHSRTGAPTIIISPRNSVRESTIPCQSRGPQTTTTSIVTLINFLSKAHMHIIKHLCSFYAICDTSYRTVLRLLFSLPRVLNPNTFISISVPGPPTDVSVSLTNVVDVLIVTWTAPASTSIGMYAVWHDTPRSEKGTTFFTSAKETTYQLQLGDVKPGDLIRVKVRAISRIETKGPWSDKIEINIPKNPS